MPFLHSQTQQEQWKLAFTTLQTLLAPLISEIEGFKAVATCFVVFMVNFKHNKVVSCRQIKCQHCKLTASSDKAVISAASSQVESPRNAEAFYRERSNWFAERTRVWVMLEAETCVKSTHTATAALLLHVLWCSTGVCPTCEWKHHFQPIAAINTVMWIFPVVLYPSNKDTHAQSHGSIEINKWLKARCVEAWP